MSEDPGQPVQVVEITDGKFKVNEDALRGILYHKLASNVPVVVMSIVGPFRTGKSFILTQCVRYLSAENPDIWLNNETAAAVKGFESTNKSICCTQGLFLWSKPIVRRLPNGQSVAIILMDTQGIYDHNSRDEKGVSIIIFALSMLLSSNMIVNQQNNFLSFSFEEFEYFVEHGLEAFKKDGNIKPFQKLLFLISDWQLLAAHKHGFEGGSELLKEWFENPTCQKMQQLHRRIKQCFTQQSCFLMPHPGKAISEGKVHLPEASETQVNQYDADYKVQLNEFVTNIFAPENLTIKRIGRQHMTGKSLYDYFCRYVKMFNESEASQWNDSITDMRVELENLHAQNNIKNEFARQMQNEFGEDTPYVDRATLREGHSRIVLDCLRQFDELRIFGGKEASGPYRTELETYLTGQLGLYLGMNNGKLVPMPVVCIYSCIAIGIILGIIGIAIGVLSPFEYIIGVVLSSGFGLAGLVFIVLAAAAAKWPKKFTCCDGFQSCFTRTIKLRKCCCCLCWRSNSRSAEIAKNIPMV